MVNSVTTPAMTREAFLAAYRADLSARHSWARDDFLLDCLLSSVLRTLNREPGQQWYYQWYSRSESVNAAWQSIGGKGSPTLKALCALPSTEGK